MNTFIKMLMSLDKLSCKRATYLAVKREEKGLNFKERIQLWYHYRLCYVCKVWEDQSALLGKLIRDSFPSTTSRKLTEREKEDIKSAIRN
jgi:hypothetical protein